MLIVLLINQKDYEPFPSIKNTDALFRTLIYFNVLGFWGRARGLEARGVCREDKHYPSLKTTRALWRINHAA